METPIPQTIEAILKKFPINKNYSKDIVVRCPYCGDSVKNPRSCHMYIAKFPIAGMYQCHCFRCEKVTPLINFLVDNDIVKYVPKSEIQKIYEADTTVSFKQALTKKDKSFRVPLQKFNRNSNKIKYILSRIGSVPKQVKKYVVTEFPFEKDQRKREWLNKNFVGFVTYLRQKVICRNITGRGCRYIDLNFSLKEDYFLFWEAQELELMNKGSIFIAEGIFSLIGGYHFLKKANRISSNSILIASGGKAAITSALRFTTSIFGIPDWDVIVLGDSEVEYEYYKYKVRNAGFHQLKILYNKHGEDFGFANVSEAVEIIA